MSTGSAPFAARVNKELGGLGCGEGTDEPRWFPELQLHPRTPRAGGILPYLDPGAPNCRQLRNYSKKMPWLSPPELVVRVWHWGECGHSSPGHTSSQAGQAAGQTQPKSFANLFLNNQEFCKGRILHFLGPPFLPGSHPPGSFHNCFQFLEEEEKKNLFPPESTLTHRNVNNWSRRTPGLKDELIGNKYSTSSNKTKQN